MCVRGHVGGKQSTGGRGRRQVNILRPQRVRPEMFNQRKRKLKHMHGQRTCTLVHMCTHTHTQTHTCVESGTSRDNMSEVVSFGRRCRCLWRGGGGGGGRISRLVATLSLPVCVCVHVRWCVCVCVCVCALSILAWRQGGERRAPRVLGGQRNADGQTD